MSSGYWFDNICAQSDATNDATVTKTEQTSFTSSPFCGAFLVAGIKDDRDDAQVFREDINAREESSVVADLEEKMNGAADILTQVGCSSIDELDDNSVVSDSGSVLSIEYGSKNIVDGKTEADLSKFDDEESVVEDKISDIDDETADGGNFTGIEEAELAKIVQDKSIESSKNGFKMPIILNVCKDKDVGSSAIIGDSITEGERKAYFKKLKSVIATHGRYSLKAADILVATAKFHANILQFEAAQNLYKEAIQIYSCKNGDNDSNVTKLQVDLGQVMDSLGEVSLAMDLFSRSFFMYEDMFGATHSSTCEVRSKIARVLHSRGFYKDAMRNLKASLRGYRLSYGDEHVTVAETVELIAKFYTDSGEHIKANSVIRELVKLRLALHGIKSLELANCLTMLSDSYCEVGDIVNALKTMKQAYALFHDLDGANSLSAEETLEKIGFLYTKVGKTGKAIKAHTSVALTRKSRCGDKSIEMASSYRILGKAYLDDSKFDKSIKALNRAISIYGNANHGSNSYLSELMETLHTIGLLHQKTKDYVKAVRAFEKENNVRLKYMEYDKIGLAKSTYACGSVNCAMKKFIVGKEYLLKALKLYDECEGRKIIFAEILNKYGQAMEALDFTEQAKASYKESMQILLFNNVTQSHELMLKVSKNCKDFFENKIEEFRPDTFCSVLDGARFEI